MRSAWAGLRPLVTPSDQAGHTSKVSREHTVVVAPSGLLTVTGGKWTTYRHMAETVLATAMRHGLLDQRACATHRLPLSDVAGRSGPVSEALPELDDNFVVRAVREEGALTVEDVLARRHRLLLLDARAAMAQAPEVAATMARERGFSPDWAEDQVQRFRLEATKYLV